MVGGCVGKSVPIPTFSVVGFSLQTAVGNMDHQTQNHKQQKARNTYVLAHSTVSCSPTNKNISVAGKDEQAWLPSHGPNYSRGRKDSWAAGKEQGYLRTHSGLMENARIELSIILH